MRRLVVLLFVALVVACAPSPPPYEHELCVTECMKCPDLPCDVICDQLQTGIDSETCHDASQDVWLCAIENGCNFPTICDEEVETFLTCEP